MFGIQMVTVPLFKDKNITNLKFKICELQIWHDIILPIRVKSAFINILFEQGTKFNLISSFFNP